MISIVDEYMASNTITSREISDDVYLVNLVWKGNILLLTCNFQPDGDLTILTLDASVEDDEVVYIKEIINEHVQKKT